jgi:type VI secretion system protein ImpB
MSENRTLTPLPRCGSALIFLPRVFTAADQDQKQLNARLKRAMLVPVIISTCFPAGSTTSSTEILKRFAMANTPTAPPKERVNIVYKSATDGAQAEVELPNKLLVVGDFTLKPDDRQIEDREPISVDKDNFDDVLKGQGLSLDLTVDNRLSDEKDAKIPVHLDFASLKDFEPDSVAKAVPEVASLLEIREALKALKGPLANIPDFRKKIQSIVKDEAAREQLLTLLDIPKE